jgi:hypothetical protein
MLAASKCSVQMRISLSRCPHPPAEARTATPGEVHFRPKADTYELEVRVPIASPIGEIWALLTAEGATEFVSPRAGVGRFKRSASTAG